MLQFSFFILVVSLSIATLVVCRPIYNIAHMVNAVKQIDEYLNYGANALEADVSFSDDGTPDYFWHGAPCDFGRYCGRWAYIGNYINALRDRTQPDSQKFNRRLVLVMFDVKLTSLKQSVLFKAGQKFADNILIPLYENNPTKMKVMISVPNLDLKDFISGVLKQLKTNQPDIIGKIGFEISAEKKVKESKKKEEALRRLGVAPGHAWLSSGTSNWFANLYLDELKAQVKYRDNGNYFSKVYAWTLDKKSTAIKYLSIDLDGVIANYPGRVNAAIDEMNEKKETREKLKLATLDDDPFNKY